MMGWVASCALVGCIAGALFAGKLSDVYGRRKVLILSAILFAVSSIGIAIPLSLDWFIFFRLIGGLGIGIASILAPMYISEIAPANIRGELVSINQLGIVSGILLIYFVNYFIAGLRDEAWNISTGWRWMFGSGAIPSVIFLILLFFVPESPRWLSQKSKWEEAGSILTKINGSEKAEKELKEIRQSLAMEQSSFADILKPGVRKSLLIGIVLCIFSQVTGINAIMYYAPEIFKSTGDASSSALMQTVLVGVINLLFTLVAIKYVDKWGRRTLLLIGAGGMAVCLAIVGSAFYFGFAQGYLVLIAILAYISFFAISLGPLAFVVISEIFSNKNRGMAMSVCVFFLWVSVYVVSQTFPMLLASIGSAFTFWIYMVMSICAFVFVLKFIPETKGKSLEEIEKYWLNQPGKSTASSLSLEESL
jgi:SP family arabinose:H+ symporter-like MFS transporter